MLRARLGRQWRVGDKLPPVKELAKQLGVGQTNTQLAVRELASDGLLVSRRRQGTYVAGLPESRNNEMFADMLAGRDVVLYSAAPTRSFIADMMDAFTQEIEPAGASVRRANVTDLRPNELDPDADAVVLFNPYCKEPIHCEKGQLLTVVSTTRFVQVAEETRYDIVGIDEYQGGMLAGQLLRNSGCKRPCFFGRRLGSDQTRFDATSSLRLHGFEAGWGEMLPEDCLFRADRYSPMAAAAAFQCFLEAEDRPDAIFAVSDDMAFGILVAANSHGLVPGKDFQIVGFDGQDGRNLIGEMALSTVRVPGEQLGRRAARMLMERFNEPNRPTDRLSLECIVHHGDTTRHATDRGNLS